MECARIWFSPCLLFNTHCWGLNPYVGHCPFQQVWRQSVHMYMHKHELC